VTLPFDYDFDRLVYSLRYIARKAVFAFMVCTIQDKKNEKLKFKNSTLMLSRENAFGCYIKT